MRLPLKTIIGAVLASPQGRRFLMDTAKKLNTPANRAKAKQVLGEARRRQGAGRPKK